MRLLVLALLLAAAAHAAPPTGSSRQVLQTASPRVNGEEFSRRLLSPIAADDVARFLQSQGRTLAPEPFAAGIDGMDVYVPATMPAQGYGLVVFVPPGDDFFLPRDWKAALEKRGLVFASLRRAGNDADVIGRRIPLVLHATDQLSAALRIDPRRVYVAGFSGGARLAQRVAMAWPDLYSGSLQLAGSVVVGSHRLPPPPAPLAATLQDRLRLVLVSGVLDLANRRNDAETRESLRALCVAGERGFSPARLDHWVPDGRAFARALDLLETPVAADAVAQAACRRRLDAEMNAAMDQVQADADAGRRDAAVAGLVAVDDRYGGLAMPRSLAMARAMLAGREPAGH